MKFTAERGNTKNNDNTDDNQAVPQRRTKSDQPNPEDALDEALEETFPASDPISLIQPVKKRRKDQANG